jgi:hypothetical protein
MMPRKSKYQTVRKSVKRLSLYDFDGGTPADAIEIFENLRKEFEGRDVKLDYYHDDLGAYLEVYETRLETDAEQQLRLEQEKAQLVRKRKQFERLKKELGET